MATYNIKAGDYILTSPAVSGATVIGFQEWTTKPSGKVFLTGADTLTIEFTNTTVGKGGRMIFIDFTDTNNNYYFLDTGAGDFVFEGGDIWTFKQGDVPVKTGTVSGGADITIGGKKITSMNIGGKNVAKITIGTKEASFGGLKVVYKPTHTVNKEDYSGIIPHPSVPGLLQVQNWVNGPTSVVGSRAGDYISFEFDTDIQFILAAASTVYFANAPSTLHYYSLGQVPAGSYSFKTGERWIFAPFNVPFKVS